MATLFVQANQVVGVNGQAFLYPNVITGVVNGIAKQLNCENLSIVNSFWKIPWVIGTRIDHYTYEVAVNTSTPPTADAIKVLIVKDNLDQTEYEIAIANTDNIVTTSPPNQLAYLCDGSGGTLPVMPTVTIPFPIVQFLPTSVSGGNNTFTIVFPANPLALEYSIPVAWFNGIVAAPAYAPTGITTAAGFVTWANANWSAYGTWANPSGDIVTLVSATTNVSKMGMMIALTPKAYCFDLTSFSTPALVNELQFGTGAVIKLTPFMLTNDPNVLQAQLAKVLSAESSSFSQTVAHKLGLSVAQATPKLRNSGTTVVTASAGAC